MVNELDNARFLKTFDRNELRTWSPKKKTAQWGLSSEILYLHASEKNVRVPGIAYVSVVDDVKAFYW